MYIVSVIIVIFTFVNYFLSFKLYDVPQNKEFLNNVNEVRFTKDRYIAPEPKYVVLISILLGILMGMYISLSSYFKINKLVVTLIILMLSVCYLIEITRRITLKDRKIILSKAFSKTREIPLNSVKGIYIYSYNKKFFKKHAFTTKLVIVTKTDKTYKFVLSSLDNKAVLNMIRETFGVNNYKMYISKNKKNEN